MDSKAFLVLCFAAAIWAFFHSRSSKKKSAAYAIELELILRDHVRGMKSMGRLDEAEYHTEIADAIFSANSAVNNKRAIPQHEYDKIRMGLVRATDPYFIDRFIVNIDNRQSKCSQGLYYIWKEAEKLSEAK